MASKRNNNTGGRRKKKLNTSYAHVCIMQQNLKNRSGFIAVSLSFYYIPIIEYIPTINK